MVLSGLSLYPLYRLVHLETVHLLQIRTRGELQTPEVIEMVDPVVPGKHDQSIIVQDRDVVTPSDRNLAGYRLGFPF